MSNNLWWKSGLWCKYKSKDVLCWIWEPIDAYVSLMVNPLYNGSDHIDSQILCNDSLPSIQASDCSKFVFFIIAGSLKFLLWTKLVLVQLYVTLGLYSYTCAI